MTQSRGELDLIGSNSKSVRTNTVYDRGELEGANSIRGESGRYLLLLKNRNILSVPRILKQPTLQRKSNNLRDSPQTRRKPFSHAISLEKAQFYGTQTKTCFSCNIAERSLFTHTQKNALFYVTQSSNQPQIAENTPKRFR